MDYSNKPVNLAYSLYYYYNVAESEPYTYLHSHLALVLSYNYHKPETLRTTCN